MKPRQLNDTQDIIDIARNERTKDRRYDLFLG